jgi:hypothetical protein
MCEGGGLGVPLYLPGCGGCVSSPSLVLSSPRCWCRRGCRSLLLLSLSPRCRPVVSVVPSKRPPAPAIPPASSGSQWRVQVLGCRFVGGLCRSSSAISTPQSTLRAVARSGEGGCWGPRRLVPFPSLASSLSSLHWC